MTASGSRRCRILGSVTKLGQPSYRRVLSNLRNCEHYSNRELAINLGGRSLVDVVEGTDEHRK